MALLRAAIALARGDLEGASAGSEKALDRARMTKDPQVLAPALAFRGIVLLEEGRREEASLASELPGRGSVWWRIRAPSVEAHTRLRAAQSWREPTSCGST